MVEKKTYDFRGSQARIFRLYGFQKGGLVHALFYRILIFASIAYGILLLGALVYSGLGLYVKAATAIIWILLTPQLFAAMKAFALTSTHGKAFGRFSDSYSELVAQKRKLSDMAYKALPYFVLAVWAVFFVLMLRWWPA